MAEKYLCTGCKKSVTATKNDRYRTHTDGEGERCDMSSEAIPEHILAQPAEAGDDPGVPKEGVDYAVCPQEGCGRKVALTGLGHFEPHDKTLRGGDRCPGSGEKLSLGNLLMAKAAARVMSTARTSESAGAEPDATADGATASEPETEPSPESTSTPPASNEPPPVTESGTSSDAPGETEEPASAGPWRLAPAVGDVFEQPFSPFSQPGEIPARLTVAQSMSERGKEIAARLRETFYAYTNRNASDNRSAQRTLGPSEIGSPCDRQIAMKLLGVDPVNPQEGWAPFVGTAVHEELARMFQWANGAQSGRYEVEMRLSFGNPLVPKGTGDLLDRVMMMFLDHKLMGRWSLDKLIQQGPSEVYRAQVHTYGYGAELAGEKVKEVAIIGWPRQESSLDKLYVHVEKYDKRIALDALKRVQDIASSVSFRSGEIASNSFVSSNPLEVAATFPTDKQDSCRWCPFHLKGDKEMRRGCPGV